MPTTNQGESPPDAPTVELSAKNPNWISEAESMQLAQRLSRIEAALDAIEAELDAAHAAIVSRSCDRLRAAVKAGEAIVAKHWTQPL